MKSAIPKLDKRVPASRLRHGASLFLISLCAGLWACSAGSGGNQARPAGVRDVVGVWRVVLDSPGGELPVTIEIFDPDKLAADQPPALMRNGTGSDPISEVIVQGRRVTLRAAHYDSALSGDLDAGGQKIMGTWQKTSAQGRTSLPFHAYKGDEQRFVASARQPGAADAVPSVAGAWSVTFTNDHETMPALGEFAEEGGRVTGTFLTSRGDTRYLAGQYREGVLELSSFNGAFASLFRARAREDGTLVGQFWSNDDDYFNWTARRVEGTAEVLPDPYKAVKVLSKDGRIHFSFPDLAGKAMSLEDERFQGKPVVVVLMGSWCQNCNDEAPLLSGWYRRYRGQGLEIVGLSYEFTGDVERDRRQLEIYRKRHRIEFPLLLAGTTDTDRPLADLSEVASYPTTVFIGRDGKVRKVHMGFAGPSTGEHHKELIARFEADIEALLAESAP